KSWDMPCVEARSIEQVSNEVVKPKIVSFYAFFGQEDNILMLSITTEQETKCFSWKRYKTEQPIEFVEGEIDILQKFREIIKNADLVVGFSSDEMFEKILQRASHYKMPFPLTFDNGFPEIRKGEFSGVKIEGLPHIDLEKWIRKISHPYTKIQTLHDASKLVLGKEIKKIKKEEFIFTWDNLPEQLDEYVIHIISLSKAVFEIANKEWNLIEEMCKLTTLPIFELTRSSYGQIVESHFLKELIKEREIIPAKPSYSEIIRRKLRQYKGGLILEPIIGIHENIMIVDFRSLYPSIIISHNIGLDTLNCKCCSEKNKKTWFCKNKKSIYATIVERLLERRARIEELSKKEETPSLIARDKAIKTLSNAVYGYFGYPASRWYNFSVAKEITSLGRKYIEDTIEQWKKEGFYPIYADTDSVFLKLQTKTRKQALETLQKINLSLPEPMKLELEGFFKIALFVSAKEHGFGAKKKYALVDDDDIITTKGFETQRSNYSLIAKKTQQTILELLLRGKNQDAQKYVQKTIEMLLKKEVPISNVIISVQLQKDISKYEAISPHVAIAKQMIAKGIEVKQGMMINYVVCRGEGIIRDKAKLPEDVKEDEYDSKYYIENQIIPIVKPIFDAIGVELPQLPEQSKLVTFIKQEKKKKT
ncbi:MAG: DNA-directed DNA polymerase, partial [Candidatus Woesearchaeota archaeon]